MQEGAQDSYGSVKTFMCAVTTAYSPVPYRKKLIQLKKKRRTGLPGIHCGATISDPQTVGLRCSQRPVDLENPVKFRKVRPCTAVFRCGLVLRSVGKLIVTNTNFGAKSCGRMFLHQFVKFLPRRPDPEALLPNNPSFPPRHDFYRRRPPG